MFAICVFQYVNASRHLVTGDINGYCLHIPDIVYGVLGQNCDKTCLANKFQQCVYFVEFDADLEAVVIRHDAVESIAGLQDR